MHAKKISRTVEVVGDGGARSALGLGPAFALSPEEERVARMRLGAPLPLSARLERIATATDAEIEIMAYEIEAYLKLSARAEEAILEAPRNTVVSTSASSRADSVVSRTSAAPVASRTKEKIVRALRKKS